MTDTSACRIEYRHGGAKHTIRLHSLAGDGIYGLEIGRWAGVFGEASPIVAPREQLLQLRDMITELVERETDSSESSRDA